MSADDATRLLRGLTEAGYVVDAHALEFPHTPEATRRRLATETIAMALRLGRPTTDEHTPHTDEQTPQAGDHATHPGGHGADEGPRPGHGARAAMRRRLRAHVVVTGSSRLAVPIASILAASGVGQVDADQTGLTRLADAIPGGLLPADAHRPRGVAAADALRRVAPDLHAPRPSRRRSTFAVLVGFEAPANVTALSYGARRIAHLAVSVRDGTVVVGPLVRPGQSPCLNCLDLTRQSLDPDWQAIAAQLHTGPDLAESVTVATALTGATFAAFEVLTHIDGGAPATVGATVEISEPGRSVRRQWRQHPSCWCRRRARGRSGSP
jgi:bacteriocin biosynthesis cyclodehydratase domain-containing protein